MFLKAPQVAERPVLAPNPGETVKERGNPEDKTRTPLPMPLLTPLLSPLLTPAQTGHYAPERPNREAHASCERDSSSQQALSWPYRCWDALNLV